MLTIDYFILLKRYLFIHLFSFLLLGAAIMNNTFVLGIFMLLIFYKGLTWTYFAETLSIFFVIFTVGLMSLKSFHTVLDGFFILSLYPLSLVLVGVMEHFGWN